MAPKIISCIFLKCLFVLLVSALISFEVSGQSIGKLESEGDRFFEAGDFRSALKLYRQAGLDQSRKKKTRLRVGISMYEINDVDGAVRIFHSLINEGKTEAPVYFYMAKCYQAKNLFPEAISHYKKFLQKTKDDDPRRIWVKDELTRCANGARLKFADHQAYVENAGTVINTQYAEFGVKNSPTTIDKIYFSSDRNLTSSSISEKKNIDIYNTYLENGRWSTPEPLPSTINTKGYEELSGFSSDGQVLYYLTSVQGRYAIMTDTFSGEEGIAYQGPFESPYNPDSEGTDLTFFNDSICLFAADMVGGFGGYDLYISTLSNGHWSRPHNLGPTINSFYNERFPFLTRNGQTLFFSSDQLGSIGGYDIFSSAYDDKKHTWSFPVNAGIPVNSSLDDTHIVLAPDGMTAFISSDRKDSHGDYDIYRIFFKQPVQAHQEISFVPTFYQSMILSGHLGASKEMSNRPPEVKEYFISHLFIDASGDVLTPQNTRKLDLLTNLLLIYPEIKAELSSFEVPAGQNTFSLYFSIKKSQAAAEYLRRKGVAAHRLILKGYGSSFPLATNPGGSIVSPVYLKLNHRLEISLHDFENEPVITHLENIPIPDNIKDPRGTKFNAARHGMYYSVQIASISQILQNLSLESVEEMFIEVDNTQGNYQYMAGMLSGYVEAEKKWSEMVQLGFTDAFIVPYLDGIRIKPDQIPSFAIDYPDLLIYLEKTKK